MTSTVVGAADDKHAWKMSVGALSAAILARDLSPVDVATQALARIAEINPSVNAVCQVAADSALAAARHAERDLAAGRAVGPLCGIPVLVKDMLFTRGLRTTGGSQLYSDFIPLQDDVAVERLRAAGAIILGKTNTAEFGFSGNQTANQLFGATRNPWNLTRTPGGSSGGSAASVAAGMVPVALGSDGGGSIRIPSSFCGTVGLKPTFGRVPLHPSCRDASLPGFSGWESLEHVGPITRDVRDSALMLDVLSGFDSRDRLSVPSPPGTFADDLDRADITDLGDLRIAYSADWGGTYLLDDDVRASFDSAIAEMKKAGARITEDSPDTHDVIEAFGLLVDLDFDRAALAELCAGREDLLGPRLQELLSFVQPSEGYSRAMHLRKQIYLSVDQFFNRYDVLLTPTTPVTAFPLECNGPDTVGGVEPEDRVRAIIGFCCPFNITGHPAISIPWAVNAVGLPVGVQFVAQRFREDHVLRCARALELASGFAERGDLLIGDYP